MNEQLSGSTEAHRSSGLTPRQWGEAYYDAIVRAYGPGGPHEQLPESEIARIEESLAQVSTVPPDADLENAGHFTRAILGIEPPPTYIIDPEKVNRHAELRGGGAEDGFSVWFERVTGEPWPRGAVGHYLLRANIVAVYLSKAYTTNEIIVHESTHAGGLVLSNLWNEGIAMLVQKLYTRYQGNKETNVNLPVGLHQLGLFATAAVCNEHPDLFDKMTAVVREPSHRSYGDLVERFVEATRCSSRDFSSSLYLNISQYFTEYPDALHGFIPEQYFDGQIRLDALLPSIVKKLTDYEQRTGYSFGPGKARLLGSAALTEAVVRTEQNREPGDGMVEAIEGVIASLAPKPDQSS